MAVDPILQPDYVGDAETGLNYIFVDFAWAIGYYHEEFGSNGGGQPQIQYAMDMHNNNVGLRIGRQLGPKATFEDVCAACDNALNDGSLIWIEGGQLTKPASYNAPGKLELTSKFPGTYGRPWYIPITTDRNGKPIKKGTPFCPHNVYPFQ